MTLAERIQAIIRDELAACGGNISETARRLGVHRRTLQRWLTVKGVGNYVAKAAS